MSFAAVQKHVAVLEKAGLLTKRRQGREALASGDVEAVRSVGVMLTELEALWRGRISRMDELFATEHRTDHRHHPPRRTDPMPVTDVQHDLDALTLTITADFAAPVERVWEVYADPRQLERVWGPPTHPATFVDHELAPGGRMNYYLTSPEGEKYYAYWDITDRRRSRPASPSATASPSTRPSRPTPTCRSRAQAYTFAATDGGTRATFVVDLRHRRGAAEGARHGRRSRASTPPSTRSTTSSPTRPDPTTPTRTRRGHHHAHPSSSPSSSPSTASSTPPAAGDHPHGGWTFKDVEFDKAAYEIKGRETDAGLRAALRPPVLRRVRPGVALDGGVRDLQRDAEVRRLDHARRRHRAVGRQRGARAPLARRRRRAEGDRRRRDPRARQPDPRPGPGRRRPGRPLPPARLPDPARQRQAPLRRRHRARQDRGSRSSSTPPTPTGSRSSATTSCAERERAGRDRRLHPR